MKVCHTTETMGGWLEENMLQSLCPHEEKCKWSRKANTGEAGTMHVNGTVMCREAALCGRGSGTSFKSHFHCFCFLFCSCCLPRVLRTCFLRNIHSRYTRYFWVEILHYEGVWLGRVSRWGDRWEDKPKTEPFIYSCQTLSCCLIIITSYYVLNGVIMSELYARLDLIRKKERKICSNIERTEAFQWSN